MSDNEKLLKQLVKPKNKDIVLGSIEDIPQPHPYCIGPKHVAWAADHHSGMLTADAIREAERQGGASCDICRKAKAGILDYDGHTTVKILFLKIKSKGREVNEIPQLEDYLLSIKKKLEALKIDGISFVKTD